MLLGVSRNTQWPFTCTCVRDAMRNRALQYYLHDGTSYRAATMRNRVLPQVASSQATPKE